MIPQTGGAWHATVPPPGILLYWLEDSCSVFLNHTDFADSVTAQNTGIGGLEYTGKGQETGTDKNSISCVSSAMTRILQK
jgi:hypothetical protein